MAQTQIFRGTARRIEKTSESTDFYYHGTRIVRLMNNGQVILNNGGWQTATTKMAMNQVANQYCDSKWGIFQKNYNWYVAYKGETLPFENGMVLD